MPAQWQTKAILNRLATTRHDSRGVIGLLAAAGSVLVLVGIVVLKVVN